MVTGRSLSNETDAVPLSRSLVESTRPGAVHHCRSTSRFLVEAWWEYSVIGVHWWVTRRETGKFPLGPLVGPLSSNFQMGVGPLVEN
jgi:hypothetical protein